MGPNVKSVITETSDGNSPTGFLAHVVDFHGVKNRLLRKFFEILVRCNNDTYSRGLVTRIVRGEEEIEIVFNQVQNLVLMVISTNFKERLTAIIDTNGCVQLVYGGQHETKVEHQFSIHQLHFGDRTGSLTGD